MNWKLQTLRPPPALLGLALLFWGWQTGLWIFAVPMALALESAHLVKSRWDLSELELNRLWDACTVLFLGAALYAYNSNERGTVTFTFFQWMPILLFLMPLAENYSVKGLVPFRTFSWFLRKSTPASGIHADNSVSVGYFYFALILIASSAANQRESRFYLGLTTLCAVAFWFERPRRFAAWKWAIVFVLAAFLGNQLHGRIHQLHTYLELRSADFWNRWWRKAFDPLESQTAMGSIGRVKQSARIVMRVSSEQGDWPSYLRAASYNMLSRETWHTDRKKFDAVAPESDLTTWKFGPEKQKTLTLGLYLKRGKGLIPIPHGASAVSKLPVGSVETNAFAALRVSEGPGLVKCRVNYDASSTIDTPPDARDLEIPERERNCIATIVDGMNLAESPDKDKLETIRRFFLDGFSYTLDLSKTADWEAQGLSPIKGFLTQTRSGHCEFYASATTLLLRKAGIPARYATGYAIDGPEGRSKECLVREKDAHAWVLAYIGDRWIDVDTTPGNWRELENRKTSLVQAINDFFSSLWYKFSQWRWNREKSLFAKSIPGLLVVLLIFIIGRTFFGKGKSSQKARASSGNVPGSDSPFYLLEDLFVQHGRLRSEHETLASWADRLQDKEALPASFKQAVRLHYRYRFDPAGLSAQELTDFRDSVSNALSQLKKELSKKRT